MADTVTTLDIKDGNGAASKLAAISSSAHGFSTFHALTGTLAADVSSSLRSISSSVSGISSSLSSIISGTAINVDLITGDTSLITQSSDRTTAAVQASYTSSYAAIQASHTASLTKLENISSSLYYSNIGAAQYLYNISSSFGTYLTDYRPYITNSIDNEPIGNLLYRISQSLTYATNTSSATLLANISSSISSSLFGTAGNLYTSGKSAAGYLSDISSSLSKISQSLAADSDTTVLNQISASLKAIDIDTTNISSSIVTTNTKLSDISSSVDSVETLLTNISSSAANISSSVTYISQSTLGYASTAAVTKITSSDFSSGIYQITGTGGGMDTTPSNRVTVQILSKVNNKLIYLIIGTQSVTFSGSVPSLFSYEMTPSGSYYAFETDLKLPHRILTGSALEAGDYVLVTQTFR